jgi:hypothetical protein
MRGGFGSLDRNANFTRMKAAFDLSARDFQRSLYTYRKPFGQTPVLRRCIPENRRVGGLLMRIGDANFTQLNTPLNLSIRRFQRRFYTYRRQFWQAPVVRRCFLEDRHVAVDEILSQPGEGSGKPLIHNQLNLSSTFK